MVTAGLVSILSLGTFTGRLNEYFLLRKIAIPVYHSAGFLGEVFESAAADK